MYWLLILQQIIAAGTHIIAKSVTKDIPAPSVLMLRAAGVCAFYLCWLAISRKLVRKVDKKDYGILLLLGLLNIPVNQFLFLTSLEHTSPAHVAFAYALCPIFVFAISVLFYKEKATKAKVLGIVIAVTGTLIVLSEKGGGGGTSITGDLLALAASLSWAMYTVLGKGFSIKYGAAYSTGLTMMCGFLLYIPVYMLLPESIVLSDISSANWLQLLYLSVLSSGIAYVIWYKALMTIEASKVSVFSNMQPVMTAVLSYFLLQTPISLTFAAGGMLILSGVFVTQRG